MAHLGYFQREFVDRRRWLDNAAYADLVALCQFLPGPASSQVAFGPRPAARRGGRRAPGVGLFHAAVGDRHDPFCVRGRFDGRPAPGGLAARPQAGGGCGRGPRGLADEPRTLPGLAAPDPGRRGRRPGPRRAGAGQPDRGDRGMRRSRLVPPAERRGGPGVSRGAIGPLPRLGARSPGALRVFAGGAAGPGPVQRQPVHRGVRGLLPRRLARIRRRSCRPSPPPVRGRASRMGER